MNLWQHLTAGVGSQAMLRQPFHAQPEWPLTVVFARAERTAAQIQAVTPNPRRLGVLMANGEPWLRAALAALRLDAAFVPLPLPAIFASTDGYGTRLARTVQAAGLDALLVDATLGLRIESTVRRALPTVPLIDITEPAALPVPSEKPVAEAGDSAVIQFTSGSTATPKGVLLSHGNVAAGLHAITACLKWTDGDAFGVWLPLFHDMGLFSLLCGLPQGSSVCLWRPSDFLRRPLAWLRSFAESGATVLPAPNFSFDWLVEAAGAESLAGLDLSRWRLACNGSETVRRATLAAFGDTFGPYGLRPGTLTPVYGLAEATLIVSAPSITGEWECVFVDRDRLDPGDQVVFVGEDSPYARAVANCGTPAPGVRLRIADDARVLEPDAVGEIQIAGDPVMAGYLDTPAEGQPFTADGWLRTGDLGFLHAGQLYVAGRHKDMITVRGQNFYAEDVEDIVRTAPRAGPRAAVAIPWQEDAGELMVVLWETRTDDAPAIAEELRDRVVRALGLDAVRVIPVPPATIPRTTSGKVQRQAARACVPEQAKGRKTR